MESPKNQPKQKSVSKMFENIVSLSFSILFHYHSKKHKIHVFIFLLKDSDLNPWPGARLFQHFSSQDTCDLHRARAPMGPKLDAITPNDSLTPLAIHIVALIHLHVESNFFHAHSLVLVATS